MERMPEKPSQELIVALAGPAVNVVIAAVLLLYLGTQLDPENLARIDDPTVSLAAKLAGANIILVLFNLIPAFPMDGGRVLRALLASRMGLLRGTRVAATLGQTLAIAGGLYGLTRSEPLLVLVAFFVFLGANAEAAAVETRVAGEGLQVRQMMVTNFRTVPVHASLNQAVELLLSGEQREFPVVDNLGRTEGILTRDNLIRGLSQLGPDATVAEVMTTDVPTVPPTLGFQEALDRLRTSRLPALPVVDFGGALVGLLTLDNITDLLLVRRARG